MILSPSGTTIEEMDAYVISLLIRIRQILRKSQSNEWPKLITEVMDSDNIDIILNMVEDLWSQINLFLDYGPGFRRTLA